MKIKYWPNQPSINLNNAVVEIFIETEKKLLSTIHNESNKYLYIDILNNFTKSELLSIILYELKELILDIIEINLKPQTIIAIKTKISKILIRRTLKKFLLKFSDTALILDLDTKYKDNHLTEYLLTYLIFGASNIQENIFLFDPPYTPYNHVKILLENFIIEISNVITKKLIYTLNYSHNINILLSKQKFCNKMYSSQRSITLFLNNLKIQNTIESSINDIKSLYNEKRKVWTINSNRIKIKYIHLSNQKTIKKLNQIQVFFVLFLEIKDLMIPKTEKFIIQIIKYLLYCSINFFSNLFLILIRIITIYLNK